MPRKKIAITDKIETLSILDANGVVDKKLEPALPDSLLLDLYRAMVLGRRFELFDGEIQEMILRKLSGLKMDP